MKSRTSENECLKNFCNYKLCVFLVLIRRRGFVRDSYSWFKSPRKSWDLRAEGSARSGGGNPQPGKEKSPWLEGFIFCEARAVVLV